MNDIAYFYNDKNIYWHGIIMAIAVAAFITAVFAFRILQRGNAKGLGLIAAAAIPAALFFSRFTYCFFALDSFSEIKHNMLSANGGNSLLGAGLGVVTVVLLARLFRLVDNIAELFDCIAPSAALGIGIGRISAIFGLDDRGMEIAEDITIPIISCTDKISGNRVVAVFAYESILAVLMFIALLVVFILKYASEKSKQNNIRSGDIALLFLAMFGTSQGVLESMRTDSLTVVGLGFVRVLQIAALICILIAVIVFSVRALKENKNYIALIISWVIQLALLGVQVYIEFKITADSQVMMHMIMTSCMLMILAAVLWQYKFSRGKMMI